MYHAYIQYIIFNFILNSLTILLFLTLKLTGAGVSMEEIKEPNEARSASQLPDRKEVYKV